MHMVNKSVSETIERLMFMLAQEDRDIFSAGSASCVPKAGCDATIVGTG
jgi:hypothetical protein